MTPEDWDHRFEQLFNLYLVDFDNDFYEEVIPFKKPEEVESKIDHLETQNLVFIARLTDMETQNEECQKTLKKRKAILGAQ